MRVIKKYNIGNSDLHWILENCSLGEWWFGIQSYVKLIALLPILASQDSNSKVENKFHEIWKRIVRLN